MKKLSYSLFLVLAIASLVVGCSKDDDNATGGAIVGTWDVSLETYYATRGGLVVINDTFEYERNEYFFNFFPNGTLITSQLGSSGLIIDTAEYSYSGTSLTLYLNNLSPPDTTVLNASLAGNNLTMSISGVDTITVNPLVLFNYDYRLNATRR